MILLDTHVWLWSLVAPERLGEAATSILKDGTRPVYVSAISVYEVETKRRTRGIDAPWDLTADAARDGFKMLLVGPSEAELAGRLDWDHRDPWDRLLVAQSRKRELALMTADRQILEFEQSAFDARL